MGQQDQNGSGPDGPLAPASASNRDTEPSSVALTKNERARFTVDQDGWTGGYQLSIENDSHGFRIKGPKYNGSSKRLITAEVDGRARSEIAFYLGFGDVLAAAKALVDRNCQYSGPNAVIPCADHAEAIRLVANLRAAIANAAGC